MTDGLADMGTARATCFGVWADEYHQWRPSYPEAAVDWLVPPNRACVAEVGAGTGKLTDRLVGRGLDLDIVEPDRRMLEIIRARHPGLSCSTTGSGAQPGSTLPCSAQSISTRWNGSGSRQAPPRHVRSAGRGI